MTHNREIQHLAHTTRRPGVVLHDGTTAHPGDQIATRRNDPRLRTDSGEKVRNRHTWTVTAVGADGGIIARHEQRGTVTLPAGYVAEHVELGWAVTGYGNQGDTVDIGIAVLEPTSSRNHAYVAMTRGRDTNHALILDPTGTADPSERLAEIIARPASNESALAVQQRLYRAAGVEPPELGGPVSRDPNEVPAPAHNDPREDNQVHNEISVTIQARLDRLEQPTPGSPPDRSPGL